LTTAERNAIAEAVDEAIDAVLAGRKISPMLRGSLFLSIESRARDNLQPALTDEHRRIVERFARAKP
jgi:hypothetical protein